jgi:hypothetical protein
MQDVFDQLSTLAPKGVNAPRPAAQAFDRLQQRIELEEENKFSNQLRRFFTMSNRKWAYALVGVLLFVFAFSFPQVRAAANNFLGLFRVQQFTAITISPQQISILREVSEKGLTPGELEILNDPGQANKVGSLEEAQELTGLTAVRTITDLGEPEEIYTMAGGNGRLTIDLEGARAIVEAVGGDPSLLPDSLDGAQVEVDIFSSVQQGWSDGIHLMQTESPVVEYPNDLDPTLLGEALLQVLGMTADEAHNLAQSIDWTSTLLLPIPRDVATFSQVTVDGVSGLALNSLSGKENAILWQKDGMVYLLTGAISADELLNLANSMQ